jgi:hypothetical protein
MSENEAKAPDLQVTAPQEGAQVGDEAVNSNDSPVVVGVNSGDTAAQVTPQRSPDADRVQVHEVVVHTDEVITDPSDPRAVQIPDAGRGSLDLPIHALAEGTVEDKFSASDDDEETEEYSVDSEESDDDE